jgi:hypothetical protein
MSHPQLAQPAMIQLHRDQAPPQRWRALTGPRPRQRGSRGQIAAKISCHLPPKVTRRLTAADAVTLGRAADAYLATLGGAEQASTRRV